MEFSHIQKLYHQKIHRELLSFVVTLEHIVHGLACVVCWLDILSKGRKTLVIHCSTMMLDVLLELLLEIVKEARGNVSFMELPLNIELIFIIYFEKLLN